MYRDEILKAYGLYKKMANSFYSKGDMENVFSCLYYACSVMHAFQIQLSDTDIEELLGKAVKRVLGEASTDVQSCEEKILMYDSLGQDNIALSLQYVTALTKLDTPFVYVLSGNVDKAERIIRAVKESPNGEIIFINPKQGYCERTKVLYECIQKANPTHAVLHMANGDVVGAAVWAYVQGVVRFMINHGDEQFWIGTNALDYLICFRGMGVNTAIEYRGINRDKMLILPYYPVISEVSFQGWDFDVPEDSVLLFSGGRFKKIYGENNEFSKMVAQILKENPNAFFLFAGSGDAQPFIDELKKENVSDRCKVFPYRKDLSELMKHVDIYLSTYPQSGGLMAQYAANAGLPIVERDCMVGGISEDMLPKLDPDIRITYQSEDAYYAAINSLIASEEKRQVIGSKIRDGLMNKMEFENGLKTILFERQELFHSNNRISNVDLRSQRLIDGDEQSTHRLWGMLLNKHMLRKSPFMFVKAIVEQQKYFGATSVVNSIKRRATGERS